MRTIALGICLTLLSITPFPRTAHAEVTEEMMTQIRALIDEGLASEDVAVQAWAIRTAGQFGDRDYRDAVTAGLENANASTRIASAMAMLAMGVDEDDAASQLVTEIIEGDAQSRTLILDRMLSILDEDVREDVLASALEQAEGDVLRSVVRRIAVYEDGDIYNLLERVTEVGDADTRGIYVSALAGSGRPEALSIASLLIETDDPAMEEEGAEIAFSIETQDAQATLEPLLTSSNAELAQRVGFHLAAFGNTSALSLAADLARNAEMPEERRIEALAMLRDNGADLMTLEELQGLAAEEGRSREFVIAIHEVVGALGTDAAVAFLQEQMDAAFADQRLYGIAGMGYTGNTAAIPDIQQTMASHGEAFLREQAAMALGNLGGDQAAEILLEALRSERSDEMKVAIIEALGRTGSASVAQTIAYEFAAGNDAISHAALDALVALGATDIASQIESVATSYRNPDVRWHATVALAQLDPELGRIRLLQSLDRPPEGFYDDLEGFPSGLLAEIDEALLTHSDTTIREAALFRIMRRPDGGLAVFRDMVTGATQADVRRQAIATVVAHADPADREIFVGLTEDADRSIRMQGYSALAELGDGANEAFFQEYLEHPDLVLRLIAAYALLRIDA